MRRILVYGVTGAGKTTLARRIGDRLGLPFHPVDDLTWEPGWVPVSDAEQRARIRAVCAGEEWVIDGAYAIWADLVLPRADLVVGLDLPRWLSWSRLLRRSVRNIVHRTPICNGNVETWRTTFLRRDSLLLFHLGSSGRKRDRMRRWQADPAMPETVLLRSPREVERWLAGLG